MDIHITAGTKTVLIVAAIELVFIIGITVFMFNHFH